MDIEDIVSSTSRYNYTDDKVLPRALRKHTPLTNKTTGDSFIPGASTVYIRTWGCSHNTSDGEYMGGLLSASGYTIIGTVH